MASKVVSGQDDMCFSCFDIFQPILLSCGHSFCKGCLQQSWTKRGHWSCPLCRRPSSREPPENSVCKRLGSSQRVQICSQHTGEHLQFFCHTDSKLICTACAASREHEGHKYTSAEKAAQEYKGIMEEIIEPLQQHLKILEKAHKTYDEAAKKIKIQALNTEREIREQFGTLHRFLYVEELSRTAALRTEEEQNIRRMRANKEELSEEINSLLEKIEILEDEMGKDDLLFLQHLNSTLDRTHHKVKKPEISCGTLIDVDKHLDNLQYQVWEKMRGTVQQTVTEGPKCHEDLKENQGASAAKAFPEGPKCPEDLKDSPGASTGTGQPSLHPALPTPTSLPNTLASFSPMPHARQPRVACVLNRLRRTFVYPTNPNPSPVMFLPDSVPPPIVYLPNHVPPPFIYVPNNVPSPLAYLPDFTLPPNWQN